ncbi:MAG: 23S rRNA (uracil(1939)-C(5))-methyltransferase RlmD [Pseudomonadales bacterium]
MAPKLPTEVTLTVDSLSAEGLGEAQHNERPMQIRNALPGEQVVARILKKRRGVRFADGVAVLGQPHSQRVNPSCTYFPRCGGCNLHHLDYQAGLELKHQQLARALEVAGIEVGEWQPPVSTGQLRYRRKARLGVRKLGDDVLVGFRESFSTRVAKIDICQILTDDISKLIEPLKRILGELSVADRIPQIEVAQGDDGLVLILRHLAPLSSEDLAILTRFAHQYEVQMLSQPGGYDSVVTLTGEAPPKLHYHLPEFSLTMQFDPRQFTQVNAAMNERLVSRAMACLAPSAGETIADLFCGIGNFSLPIARAGAQVVGFELDPSAIEQAAYNSRANDLTARACFNVHDLYRAPLPLEPVTAMLLDPPRSGAGPLLGQWVAQPALERLVYVSCNPVSFAADAHTLSQAGFKLSEAGVYDMFPYTAHVETLGYFVRA